MVDLNPETTIDVGRSLAGKGFFPETLPPCFSSSALSDILQRRQPEINAARLSRRSPAKLIRYSSTKTNGARRIFATPHPLNYLFICEFLRTHWNELEKFYAKNTTISASIPTIQSETEIRGVKITPFSDLDLLVHQAIKHSSYLLKTDIAQFYPSIYTHSVPWAFHGRDRSKGDRKPESKSVFFNELDYHLRNCQDGQTHGLFIGPDAARIISELILAAIDNQFIKATEGQILGAVRYVDDYHIGVDSEADADSVLATLNDELNKFELSTNDTKTKVIPTSLPSSDLWPFQLHRLAHNFFDEDTTVSENQLMELINCALERYPV